MKKAMCKDLHVDVSLNQCHWTKILVARQYQEDTKEDFPRLYDYVKKLKMNNKDSTIELDAPNNTYNRLYICFKAIRIGFMNGCRLIIGFDRYFFKIPL